MVLKIQFFGASPVLIFINENSRHFPHIIYINLLEINVPKKKEGKEEFFFSDLFLKNNGSSDLDKWHISAQLHCHRLRVRTLICLFLSLSKKVLSWRTVLLYSAVNVFEKIFTSILQIGSTWMSWKSVFEILSLYLISPIYH